VDINPADTQGLGISNGEEVAVISSRGEVRVKAAITNTVPVRVVFMHLHFAGTANILTLHNLDPVAKVPEYKVAACRIERRS